MSLDSIAASARRPQSYSSSRLRARSIHVCATKSLCLTHLSVLQGFGHVGGGDVWGIIEVGDGAGDFDEAEITAG